MVLKKQKNEVIESRITDFIEETDDNEFYYDNEHNSLENREFVQMCDTEERYQIITDVTKKLTEYIEYQMLPFGDLLNADDIELFLKKLN